MTAAGPIGREAPRPAVLLIALALLVLPAWVMGDALGYEYLKGDDFVYLAGSRTASETRANLLRPHNAHVVPLFRLLTFGIVSATGSLAALPIGFGVASYVALGLSMAGVGVLVARETGRGAFGLAAMAGLGLSTVLEPCVLWYSAGQALWSALATVASLLALRAWRESGRVAWLGVGGFFAMAAPALWSGGYVAGPAGAAFLGLGPRAGARWGAVVPPVAALAFAALAFAVAGRGADPDATPAGSFRPDVGLRHTAQAIPEILVGANLGVDAATTPTQGVVLTGLLAAAWGWTRRWARPTPLERAGVVLVVGGFGLAYTFRSNYEFDSLRGIGWYAAVPQVGAILFASGWAGTIAARPVSSRPRVSDLLLVAALVAALVLLHGPRASRLFLAELPTLSERERGSQFPIPSLQRLRGLHLAGERSARQRRALARVDRAGVLAVAAGLTRADVRGVTGRRLVPGMPMHVVDLDAASLLPLAPGTPAPPRPAAIGLAPLFEVEPDPRPPWLDPADPWPPRGGR